MNNHTPINERTFEFAVRITKLCSYLDKQPGTPTLREVKSQKSKVKSQNFKIFKYFVSKQSIALKEARETKYWLKLLVKSEIVPSEKIADMVDECEQLMRIIGKSIVTTKERMKSN
ncbi:MAG: four helix bundle protein [Dolichospermum sp.]|jgi:four helix bundle protein